MTAALLIWAGLASCGLFDVQAIPWTPGTSLCFPADTNLDGTAEVLVLDGHLLRAYRAGLAEPLFEIDLPPGAGPIDVADIDQDGVADLLAVCGDAVLAIALGSGGADPPRELFRLENQYSHATGAPFPSVLAVDLEHAPRIALPRSGTLEIRSPSGVLEESYPIDLDQPQRFGLGRPFSYWSSQHAQAGPPDALEIRVSSAVAFRAPERGDGAIREFDTPDMRVGTPRQVSEAGARPPEQWPWFSVGTADSGDEHRALYSGSGVTGDTSTIRIRTANAASGEVRVGPARRYPGTLLIREDSTFDIDGDSFTDILLWKAKTPGISADSLARAASERTWPIRVTAHRYLPEKQRYSPTPSGHITIDAPIAWWLTPSRFGPLRDVILRDFDGDGATDFGCLTASDTLSVWTAEDGAFRGGPRFRRRFPAPVERIHFEIDLEGSGRSTLALECGRMLYLLRPRAAQADF